MRSPNQVIGEGHRTHSVSALLLVFSCVIGWRLARCCCVSGDVLWVSDDAVPQAADIPNCAKCGAARQFEFQVLPQLLNYLKVSVKVTTSRSVKVTNSVSRSGSKSQPQGQCQGQLPKGQCQGDCEGKLLQNQCQGQLPQGQCTNWLVGVARVFSFARQTMVNKFNVCALSLELDLLAMVVCWQVRVSFRGWNAIPRAHGFI